MDNQNRRARDKRAPGTVEWDESSKPATSVPAPVSPTNLHDAIMRLPCNPPGGRGAIQYNGYVAGHRDARHGAAELAASFKIAPTAADSPSTASDELHIGVSNNDQGVHINIMQRHADCTTTMIYSAKAPTGDSYGRASLATQSAKQGAQPSELTDAAIDDVWNAMPGGADGWLKQFGYRQFARSIANHVLVRVAASMAGTIRPSDDELWDQTIGERDHYHDMADKLAEAIGKHFGIEIGEHSNMNCPWHTALDWIETENTVAEMAVAAHVQADLSDDEITAAAAGIYLSGFDDAKNYDIAIARAVIEAMKSKRAASTDGEARDE